MKLSNLADYAVVMMSAAARHCGVSGRLNATVLAEETGVPLPTAQKLVSRLSAAGLIESARGTGGGFRLSRPPSAITLADIIEAVEGPITAVGEKPHLEVVSGAVRSALAQVNLTNLSRAPLAHSNVEG